MFLRRILFSASIVVSSIVGPVATQAEVPVQSANQAAVSISNNSGGNIAAFALEAAEYLSAGTIVQFDGRCDSACTLFLGLPTQQTCINQGAFFRFHAPLGVSAKSEKIAHAYLMRKYPGWVKSWINDQRGLSRKLITMDYTYASKFIRSCDSVASR